MMAPLKTIPKTISMCVVCGKKAMETNSLNLPSCKDHIVLPTKIPICPHCDSKMVLKKGKHRTFWSCPDYPKCFGTRGLVKPDEEQDIL